MENYFNYNRRQTSVTNIGNTPLGGNNPIRVQSMTSTNTNDTEACVDQAVKIIEAGGEYVRLTAQGVREAENLKNIRAELRSLGYKTPLIADIHFNPKAAMVAAANVEKVRINPGNFVDKVKTFANCEYTAEEYAQEIEKIRSKLIPLINLCKENKTAIRIGVNHGSLSDRIMTKYGDTPEGMVESCMEFLHICLDEGFTDLVISMKTSNTVVMNQAVHLLIYRMDKENIHIPLHLGVTEAGDGEDGRIKSSVGIGALLANGIGDTIRVSLSEDPELEIPVARKLLNYIVQRENHPEIKATLHPDFSLLSVGRRQTKKVGNIGKDNLPVVISDRSGGDFRFNPHFLPDYIYAGQNLHSEFPRSIPAILDFEFWKGEKNTYPLFDKNNYLSLQKTECAIKFLQINYANLNDEILSVLKNNDTIVVILTTNHINGVGEQRAFIHTLMNAGCDTPVVLQRCYAESETEDLQIKSAADLGTLLLDGFADGVMLVNHNNTIKSQQIDSYAFGILQAARVRTSKTDYISCPSCGRTLFDLQTTVAKVKTATSHLTHLKIGVMGCIVNGPGEMADADYGYVGAEPGKISLYKKKNLIERNIPSAEAVAHLVQLIKDNGDWVEPEE